MFFLYYLERITLKQALTIDALYYIFVVVMEVPSGYLADRIGRKKTLCTAAFALVCSYSLFFFADGFWEILGAKFLFALGFSFASGAETSLHYESLKALGKEKEFGDREASLEKLTLIFGSATAVLGGWLASYELRYAFGVAALISIFAFSATLLMREPLKESSKSQENFLEQLSECFTYLKKPMLFWFFAFTVVMTILNHIPYEFYQRYVDLLKIDNFQSSEQTPLTTSAMLAVMNLIAAAVAGKSMGMMRTLGRTRFFLLATLLQGLVIFSMSSVLAWWVLLPIILYRVPATMYKAPFNHCVTPEISSRHRASFLSLLSLCGRLAFSGTLFFLITLVPKESHAQWSELSKLLSYASMIAGFALVWLMAQRLLFSWKKA